MKTHSAFLPDRNLIRLMNILLFASITITSFCQEAKTFKVKAGEDISKVIPMGEMCRYDHYQEGHLFFPSGKSSSLMRLNYNFLFDEMMFIDKKGDTLFVNNENVFLYAEIGKDIFHHDTSKGFFEILAGNDTIKLLRKQSFLFTQRDVTGSNGYGDVSSSASVVALRKVPGTTAGMTKNQDVTYTKSVAFFFMDSEKKIVKANKSSLMKLLPEKKTDLQGYLKNKKTDFDKENDLLLLMEFVNGK